MLGVVFGSSAEALLDLGAAQTFLTSEGLALQVICVNGAVRVCPVKPVAFCTVFSPKLGAERFLEGLELDGVRKFARRSEGGAFEIVRPKWHGSSGLYGVQIALDVLGFAGVILAGCPMQATAGTLCPHSEMTTDHAVDRFKPEWEKARPTIGARVRSMSGWTRELFGSPTSDWLSSLTPPEACAIR